VIGRFSSRVALIPWVPEEPVGPRGLRNLLSRDRTSRG
jgi:hypothetical protein